MALRFTLPSIVIFEVDDLFRGFGTEQRARSLGEARFP